jgi:hypothetical protein
MSVFSEFLINFWVTGVGKGLVKKTAQENTKFQANNLIQHDASVLQLSRKYAVISNEVSIDWFKPLLPKQ